MQDGIGLSAVGTSVKLPVFATDGNQSQDAFGGIVIDFQPAVVRVNLADIFVEQLKLNVSTVNQCEPVNETY